MEYLAELELMGSSDKHAPKMILVPRIVTVFGRSSGHIKINDEEMSSVHCMVIFSPQGLCIQDRGSRNGTYVNSQSVGEFTFLNMNDAIRMGNTEYRIKYLVTRDVFDSFLANPLNSEIFSAGYEWLIKNMPSF